MTSDGSKFWELVSKQCNHVIYAYQLYIILMAKVAAVCLFSIDLVSWFGNQLWEWDLSSLWQLLIDSYMVKAPDNAAMQIK